MTAPDSEKQKLFAAELQQYRGVDATEEAHRLKILKLVETNSMWWHRDTMPGHVTASAFIVSPDMDRMLLHFHRKLDRWLQVGGHDDGEQHPALAVLREIQEESGLNQFDFFGTPAIFDMDVHPIPAKQNVPGHDHLDVRFLIIADPEQPLAPGPSESTALEWVDLERAGVLMDEEGALRVLRKINVLSKELHSQSTTP